MVVQVMEHVINSFGAHVTKDGKGQIAANGRVPSATLGTTWPMLLITHMQVQNVLTGGTVIVLLANARVWTDLLGQHASV